MDIKRFQNWQWFCLKENDIEELSGILSENLNYDEKWFHKYKNNTTNEITAHFVGFDERIVKGSLVYQQAIKDEMDFKILHFYLTKQFLVTVDFDVSFLKATDYEDLHKQMEATPNAVIGFMILLREILKEYLNGIDTFEVKHRELMWKIHQRNKISTLEAIYKSRHELMIWKGLLIPVNDLTLGIGEIYLDEINEEKEFKRTCKRLERALFLTDEYQKELDTMINMENVISSHRGNEIMKTLTVMTILFTPIMAWGSLWGMNFKYMPELRWKYGYLFSILIIIITTMGLYWYLKVKGWTGDILKAKKKGSFFK
jgi:magnesium transporter